MKKFYFIEMRSLNSKLKGLFANYLIFFKELKMMKKF